MTVKELIKQLSKIENQEKEVYFAVYGIPNPYEILTVEDSKLFGVNGPVYLGGDMI